MDSRHFGADESIVVGVWNAADDYRVLLKVRETWQRGDKTLFAAHLTELWRTRCKVGENIVEQYVPGDYSRAAIAVLKGGE